MPGDWSDASLVTVTFEEKEDKTKMTLKHVDIPIEMHKDCKTGWNESFDKLAESLK